MWIDTNHCFPTTTKLQELRYREDALNKTKEQQHLLAEELNQRERALDAREMDILSRELKDMITKSTPTPNKRRGKFSKTKLKVQQATKITIFFSHAALRAYFLIHK